MAGDRIENLALGRVDPMTETAGGRPAFAEGYGEAKTDLPAFLEGGKLPEGYKMVGLQGGDTQSIRLDMAPESRMVFYLDDIGIRLTRGVGGEAYLLFEGLPLPDGVYVRDSDSGQARLLTVPANGIPLGGWLGEGSERIPVEFVRIIEGKSNRNVGVYTFEDEEVEGILIIELPFREIQYANRQVRTPNLGDLGVVFRLKDGSIAMQNRDPESLGFIIAAPVEAVVREGEADEEEDSGVGEGTAELSFPALALLKTVLGGEEGDRLALAAKRLGKTGAEVTGSDKARFYADLVMAVDEKDFPADTLREIVSITSETARDVVLEALIVLAKAANFRWPLWSEERDSQLVRFLVAVKRARREELLVIAGRILEVESPGEDDLRQLYADAVETAIAAGARLQ